MKTARVIGAGLSGLASAWCLADAGWDVEIVESSGEPGGLIHTHHTPHGLVETAANAFVYTPAAARWFDRVGLAPVFPRPESKRRYLYRDGRVRKWPLTVGETIGLVARGGRSFVTRSTKARADETIETWGARVVGKAATEWLVGAALQGIYASAPPELSAQAIFEGRRSGKHGMASPPNGMGEFIARLHEQLVAKGVRCSFGQSMRVLDAGVPTIVATNAPAAAALLAPHAPELARAIGGIRMTSIASVAAFFDRSDDDVHGFGVLFPRGAGMDALGVLFNNDIFPGRGDSRAERWIYGGTSFDPVSESALIDRMMADRERFTGRRLAPAATYVTIWPRALPVYGFSVLDVKARVGSLPPWLRVAGNYLGRLGVAALLEISEHAAATLAGD
jgi:oxygen-dependent protoporphyrinogen oxidase